MRIIFFDLCAIPIFLLILWTCRIRRITKDHASRVFIMMNAVSLACTVLNIVTEFIIYPLPLSAAEVVLGNITVYLYLLLHNSTLVLCLIYIFAITRTEYLIRPRPVRLLLWAPNMVMMIVLLQNLLTHNVFTVTAESGYSRGPVLMVLYIIAILYGLIGTIYCAYAKRYMPAGKWIALISIYVLTFIAVFIQLLIPDYMVEMFATAIALLMIMLLVLRPEETIDSAVGVQSWKAYQADLKNILLSGQHVQIVVVHQPNAAKIRDYLDENRFNEYIREITDEIEQLYRRLHVHIDLYIERPGTFYLILEDQNVNVPSLVPQFLASTRERVQAYADQGVRFTPKFCVIRCPEDADTFEDIVNLGHRFPMLGTPEQEVFVASEIVSAPNYGIVSHMDEILNRAITEQGITMYYQPIYNVKTRSFSSAEALARLIDPKYGMISPAIFIPAAEHAGLILQLGDLVLESVYRFISENDLDAMGLDYIEINLSVAQCLQAELPSIVRQLQEKYGVRPSQINFEITETMFDNLSGVMDRNLQALTDMGYTLSLDDYGVGYSNIQRLRSLPLRIIKIDKSMVDDMFTEDGEVIIRNTVRMMQGIHKELVVEGVETREAIEACCDLSCDYIQGFYYSRPLPAREFVTFLNSHNHVNVRSVSE